MDVRHDRWRKGPQLLILMREDGNKKSLGQASENWNKSLEVEKRELGCWGPPGKL